MYRHLKDNEAEAMEMPVIGQQDGSSDYGSDFTPDEEEILKSLLPQTLEQDDGPNRDPDLLLKDIEDEEGPRGARVLRRQGWQSQKSPPLLFSKPRATIQLDSDNKRSTDSTFRAT